MERDPLEERAAAQEFPDNFYQGVISKIFLGNEMGIIRSDSGREIPFIFEHVIILGVEKKIESLYEGMRVGFDVGWTSKGLRVTTIKVYDEVV